MRLREAVDNLISFHAFANAEARDLQQRIDADVSSLRSLSYTQCYGWTPETYAEHQRQCQADEEAGRIAYSLVVCGWNTPDGIRVFRGDLNAEPLTDARHAQSVGVSVIIDGLPDHPTRPFGLPASAAGLRLAWRLNRADRNASRLEGVQGRRVRQHRLTRWVVAYLDRLGKTAGRGRDSEPEGCPDPERQSEDCGRCDQGGSFRVGECVGGSVLRI